MLRVAIWALLAASAVQPYAVHPNQTYPQQRRIFDSITHRMKIIRILGSPSSFCVGPVDHRNVAIRWNYTAPRPPLQQTTFAIKVKGDDGYEDWVYHRAVDKPYREVLRLQKSNTTYNISIRTSARRWLNSTDVGSPVVAMAKDYATPFITTVLPMNHSVNEVEYRIGWRLKGNVENFKTFIVELYTARHGYRKRINFDRLNITLPYYSVFNLTVTAVYEDACIGEVNRTSRVIKDITSMGAPGPVESFARVSLFRRTQFRVLWYPPVARNGPLTYHEVIIYDPLNPLTYDARNVSSQYSAVLRRIPLISKYAMLKIRAVNEDKRYRQLHKGTFSEDIFTMPRVEPNPEKDFHLRTWNRFSHKSIDLSTPDAAAVIATVALIVLLVVCLFGFLVCHNPHDPMDKSDGEPEQELFSAEDEPSRQEAGPSEPPAGPSRPRRIGPPVSHRRLPNDMDEDAREQLSLDEVSQPPTPSPASSYGESVGSPYNLRPHVRKSTSTADQQTAAEEQATGSSGESPTLPDSLTDLEDPPTPSSSPGSGLPYASA